MNVSYIAACLAAIAPIAAFGNPPENLSTPAVVDIHPEDHQQRSAQTASDHPYTNEQLIGDSALAGRFLSEATENERWDIVRNLLPGIDQLRNMIRYYYLSLRGHWHGKMVTT